MTEGELDTLSRDLVYYSTELDEYNPPVVTAAEEGGEGFGDAPPTGDGNTTLAEE